MAAADFVQSPWKEELVNTAAARVHDHYDEDDDGDDALSLCNLTLYCDAADDSFADDDASTSSSSSDHDDFFEFSSVGNLDSSSSSGGLRSDDRRIVFCGKLISHRESPPPEKKRWPLPNGRGSQKSSSRRRRSPAARTRKCRWYLMAFGLARFSTEMALSEMRTRQSRNVEKRGSCECEGGGESRGKGLFGLLKALGLGHRRRADALVKALLGSVPRV